MEEICSLPPSLRTQTIFGDDATLRWGEFAFCTSSFSLVMSDGDLWLVVIEIRYGKLLYGA